MSGAETAGLIALTITLVKVIEKLVDGYIAKTKSDKTVDKSLLTDKERMWLGKLYDLHCRYDDDGVPLWYVPRSWADVQKEIAAFQRHMSEDQRRTVEILERVVNQMDKFTDKLNDIAAKVKN